LYTLITAANSSKAHQLKNKLNTVNIILGDHLDLPAFMVNTGNMIKLPNPASNTYTHQMLALCLDRQINSIYVLRTEEEELLKEAEQLFKEYEIEIISLIHGS
jgi:hypothetical protein